MAAVQAGGDGGERVGLGGPAEPRTLLSFDIGLKNLAVAALAVPDGRLALWRVLSLVEAGRKAPPRAEALAARLFDALDGVLAAVEARPLTVLIENQPSKGVLKTIQAWIQAYFLARQRWLPGEVAAVHLVSAAHKLRGHAHAPEGVPRPAEGAGRSAAYAYNKKMGVALARLYVADDAGLAELFEGHAKRDDLADALLQALAWARARGAPLERVAGQATS